MRIRRASVNDSEVVATLVFELIQELSAPKPASVTKAAVLGTTLELLSGSLVSAFLAESDDRDPAGVLTLNACAAIYAGGRFGEITELYVRPAFRSQKIGTQLIQAAIEFGKAQGWTRLEVCAPPVPPWERSVSFYQRNGFLLLGPRLKLPLD
jgi:GNAT superfamily N-acetyltransferase